MQSPETFEAARALTEICLLPCSDTRLQSVLQSYPAQHFLASTKSKRHKLLTRIKTRIQSSNAQGIEKFNEIISSLSESQTDYILTGIAYLIDHSAPQSAGSIRTQALLHAAQRVTNTVSPGRDTSLGRTTRGSFDSTSPAFTSSNQTSVQTLLPSSAALPPSASPTQSNSITARATVSSDEDAAELCFGDRITLRLATRTSHFLVAENGHSLQISTLPSSFILRSARRPRDRTPVRYLDIVTLELTDETNSLLQCTETNELISAPYNERNISNASFVVYAGQPILDTSSASLTSFLTDPKCAVKNGDVIILKSCIGTYISTDDTSSQSIQLASRVTGPKEVLIVHRARLPVMEAGLKKIAKLDSQRYVVSHQYKGMNTVDLSNGVTEDALVDDVLSCLLGLDGEYVHPVQKSGGVIEWRCDDCVLDISHRTLLNDRLLPLAHDYSVVHHYLTVHRRHEFGLVHHALTRAIQSIMEEYHVLIGQLDLIDRNTLTLTRLAYHLSSVQRTLRHLVTVVQSVSYCMGGAVIDVLHRQLLQAGESNHRALLLHLLQTASAPFFDMLSTWLHAGTFSDQHVEFCVVIDQSVSQSQLLDDFNATYWSSRWQFRHDRCPSFLKQYQDRILATGKYWNVLRQCSQASTRPRNLHTKQSGSSVIRATIKQSQSAALMLASGIATIPAIPYSENDGVVASLIDSAYAQASRSLINLLLRDYALIEHFTLMKHIYLLGAGDWLVHFMDSAWTELNAPAHSINRSKLQSLLDLSFSSSTSIVSINQALDQSVDNEAVTVALQPHRFDTKLNAIYQASDAHLGSSLDGNNGYDDNNFEPPNLIDLRPLTGLDSLTLNYQVDYPLSLILSKTSLTKYQLCFRLLIQLKFMERECSQIFMEQKSSKAMRWSSKTRQGSEKEVLQQRKQEINLTIINHLFRHQILSFLRNLLYYFTAEVIEPEFQGFVSRIAVAANFDTVLNDHLAFLDSICSKLLLTDMDLLNALLKIVYCIQNYFVLMRQKVQTNDAQDMSSEYESNSNLNGDANNSGTSYFDADQIELFQAEFQDLMNSFMQILSEKNQATAYALIQRLDYNGWYQTAQQTNQRSDGTHDSFENRL